MARHIDFFRLTYRARKEFCDNLTCIGHDPPLQVNIERESGIKFYTMNRKQLNEFWQCCVRDQQHFCDLECPNSCKICPWVKAVYNKLRDNFFFDLIVPKSNNQFCGRFLVLYLIENYFRV